MFIWDSGARSENKRGIHTHGYTRGLWGWFWWSVRTVQLEAAGFMGSVSHERLGAAQATGKRVFGPPPCDSIFCVGGFTARARSEWFDGGEGSIDVRSRALSRGEAAVSRPW